MLAALAVIPAKFFVGLGDFPVNANYSMYVSLAGSVHVKIFSDVELLLGTHHVIEDFEEVEAEVFGGHFGLSFLVWLVIT